MGNMQAPKAKVQRINVFGAGVGILLFAAALLFLSGCQDPFQQPPVDELETGLVSLSITRQGTTQQTMSRAILPKQDFTGIGLGFANIDNPSHAITVPDWNEGDTIEMPEGRWDLTVTAYMDANPVAEGSAQISVAANQDTFVTVVLSPIPEGQGTVTWNISFPVNDVSSASMVITYFDSGSVHHTANLLPSATASSGSRPVPAGLYRVVITLVNDKGQSAIARETLHIYRNMQSVITMDFEPGNFLRSPLDYILATWNCPVPNTWNFRYHEIMAGHFPLAGIYGVTEENFDNGDGPIVELFNTLSRDAMLTLPRSNGMQVVYDPQRFRALVDAALIGLAYEYLRDLAINDPLRLLPVLIELAKNGSSIDPLNLNEILRYNILNLRVRFGHDFYYSLQISLGIPPNCGRTGCDCAVCPGPVLCDCAPPFDCDPDYCGCGNQDCGISCSCPIIPTGVVVTPDTAALIRGGNPVAFIAEVLPPGAIQQVQWNIVGGTPSGITLSPVGLTATITASATSTIEDFTVRATAYGHPTVFGEATVTVRCIPIDVIVTPQTAGLIRGGNPVEFTAEVLPPGAIQEVEWNIVGGTPSGITLSPAGLTATITASATATIGDFTVRATAVGHPTVFGEATVTVVPAVPTGITIDLHPPTVARGPTGGLLFNATVHPPGALQYVRWSVEPPIDGVSINPASGLLTVEADVPNGTEITIRATVYNHPWLYATTTVTAIYAAATGIIISPNPAFIQRDVATSLLGLFTVQVAPEGASQYVTWAITWTIDTPSGITIYNDILTVPGSVPAGIRFYVTIMTDCGVSVSVPVIVQ